MKRKYTRKHIDQAIRILTSHVTDGMFTKYIIIELCKLSDDLLALADKPKTACHVNPNCKDSSRCEPHKEFGPVTYKTDKPKPEKVSVPCFDLSEHLPDCDCVKCFHHTPTQSLSLKEECPKCKGREHGCFYCKGKGVITPEKAYLDCVKRGKGNKMNLIPTQSFDNKVPENIKITFEPKYDQLAIKINEIINYLSNL
jgi:hypothetical protein